MNPIVKVSLVAFLLVTISACTPVREFINDPSINYRESLDFHDSSLDANRVNDVLILVNAGYIQIRNENQLSIYLHCDSLEQHEVTLVSAEFTASDNPPLKPESLGIECPDSRVSQPFFTGIYHGQGYLHFFYDDLADYIRNNDLSLNLILEVDGQEHLLSLPLRTKVAWVWST